MLYIQEIQKILKHLEVDERITPEMMKYIREQYQKQLDEYINYIKSLKDTS
jgi:hypothetical protein